MKWDLYDRIGPRGAEEWHVVSAIARRPVADEAISDCGKLSDSHEYVGIASSLADCARSS